MLVNNRWLQVYICAEQPPGEHPAGTEEEQLHLQLPGAGAALQVTHCTVHLTLGS